MASDLKSGLVMTAFQSRPTVHLMGNPAVLLTCAYHYGHFYIAHDVSDGTSVLCYVHVMYHAFVLRILLHILCTTYTKK